MIDDNVAASQLQNHVQGSSGSAKDCAGWGRVGIQAPFHFGGDTCGRKCHRAVDHDTAVNRVGTGRDLQLASHLGAFDAVDAGLQDPARIRFLVAMRFEARTGYNRQCCCRCICRFAMDFAPIRFVFSTCIVGFHHSHGFLNSKGLAIRALAAVVST